MTFLNYEDARVWWIPQVPMNPFYVPVSTIEEALLMLDTLARYDKFQFENNVKPGYSNVGGLQVLVNGEWEEWENEDGEDIDEEKDRRKNNEQNGRRDGKETGC